MDIAYLTDVEGQWEKLTTFCAGNPLVTLAGDRLNLADGAIFVFGGDAIDRGPHGRRIVDCLTRARRRYPDRVVLLAGNRDINKLRLVRELRGHPPARAPEDVRAAAPATLLKWIFANTMGAKEAFEHRRTELGGVADDQVVQSYLDDLAPTGALTQYLQLCQLTYRRGTTLFVHGGLGEASLGKIPAPAPDAPQSVGDLDEWVARLNAWYATQLAAFVAGAMEPDGTPSWQPVIAYQAPLPGHRINPQSVVYGRLADDNNDPRLPPIAVVDRLRAAGIRRLVAGHTPSGDTPSVLRDPARRFELIMADNSYGRVTNGSRVLLDDDAVRIEGAAVLDDQRRVTVAFTLAADDTTTPLGLRVGPAGHLLKAPLGAADYLGFRYLPGYQFEQVVVAIRGESICAPY